MRISPARLALAPSLLVLGCAGAAPSSPRQVSDPDRASVAESPASAASTSPPRFDTDCTRSADSGLRPLTGHHDGSPIGLASYKGLKIAYVADAVGHTIHTIDLATNVLAASTPVDGTPRQLLVLADGRVAVTIEDRGRVDVFEAIGSASGPLRLRCSRETPRLAWGIAEDTAGATLAVTSGWDAALTIFDEDTLRVRRVVSLPKAPRAVIVRDGNAYVSHLAGTVLSVVDLATDQPPAEVKLTTTKASPFDTQDDVAARRSASQGFALASVIIEPKSGPPRERIFAPHTSVDPGDAERPSVTYYGDPSGAVPKQTPIVAVIDGPSNRTLSTFVLDTSRVELTRECLLPRAAVVRPSSSRLFVACMGIDQVLELDARVPDPMRAVRRRLDVPEGPTGLAVDEASKELIVYSELAASVVTVQLSGDASPRVIDLPPSAPSAAWDRGRQLFHATDDLQITSDGLTCASCHPDGLDDGLTWRTPEGPRQTPMLAGRIRGSEPYGWTRDKHTLNEYVGDTTSRLGGRGLNKTDLAALATYVESLQTPVAIRPISAAVARGQQIFSLPRMECASCHPGGAADGRGHLLDLSGGISYDTPSLQSVAASAPYFHDGRYPSLDALLSDSKNHMGRAFELSPDDRGALRAYLESL